MTDAAMMPQLRPTPVGGKGAKAGGGQKPVLADAFATAVGRDPAAQRDTVRSTREPPVAAIPDAAADAPQAAARGLADALAALGARYAGQASAEGEEPAHEPVTNEGVETEADTGPEIAAAPEPSAKDRPLPTPGQEPEKHEDEAKATDTDRSAPAEGVATVATQAASVAQAAEAGEFAAPVAASRQADAPALREDRRREPASPASSSRAETASATVTPERTQASPQPTQAAAQAVPAVEADSQPRQAGLGAAPVRATAEDAPQDDAPAPRVTVVASQTVAAPAAPAAVLPSPAQQLASAMTADLAPASEAGETQSRTIDQPAPRAAPVHSLTIQLQPAELGRVTARMTLADGQLAVAVVVETEEARSRIARDSDMIAGALRQAGYEVDRIVVQHVQPSAQTAQQGGADRSGQGLGEQAGQAREDQQRDRSGGDARDEHRPGAGARSETGDAGERRGVYI